MPSACVFLILVWTALTGNLVGVAAAQSPEVAGTVTAVAGPVTVTRSQLKPQLLKFRDDLHWLDVVEAQKDGVARALLGGKTTVTVRELSRLELRRERLPEGVRYAAELVQGRVRASVARLLMEPGEQVEVRTRNAVASVRGTDFIVDTVEPAGQSGAFGLLAARELAQWILPGTARGGETVVVTLSGTVEVANRLARTGAVTRIGANQAVRVSGFSDPVSIQANMGQYLQGLRLPRQPQVRSGDKVPSVGSKVEQAAVDASSRRGIGTPGSSRSGERSGAPGSGVPSGEGAPSDDTGSPGARPSSAPAPSGSSTGGDVATGTGGGSTQSSGGGSSSSASSSSSSSSSGATGGGSSSSSSSARSGGSTPTASASAGGGSVTSKKSHNDLPRPRFPRGGRR